MRLFRLVPLLAPLALAPTASAGTLFLLDGRGWGHGVGMSQWGAEGAARHGWDYKRILAHYYPGTKLEVWHPRPVRVLLGDGVARARIASKAPFLVADAKGKKVRLPHGIVLDGRFLVEKKRLVPPLRFRAGAQPLSYDLQGYRGDLVVKHTRGGLLVVNQVPLDRYLRGVVPWRRRAAGTPRRIARRRSPRGRTRLRRCTRRRTTTCCPTRATRCTAGSARSAPRRTLRSGPPPAASSRSAVARSSRTTSPRRVAAPRRSRTRGRVRRPCRTSSRSTIRSTTTRRTTSGRRSR